MKLVTLLILFTFFLSVGNEVDDPVDSVHSFFLSQKETLHVVVVTTVFVSCIMTGVLVISTPLHVQIENAFN